MCKFNDSLKTTTRFIVLSRRLEKRRIEPATFGLQDQHASKNISNDLELIQSDPTSCPQNQKGNN